MSGLGYALNQAAPVVSLPTTSVVEATAMDIPIAGFKEFRCVITPDGGDVTTRVYLKPTESSQFEDAPVDTLVTYDTLQGVIFLTDLDAIELRVTVQPHTTLPVTTLLEPCLSREPGGCDLSGLIEIFYDFIANGSDYWTLTEIKANIDGRFDTLAALLNTISLNIGWVGQSLVTANTTLNTIVTNTGTIITTIQATNTALGNIDTTLNAILLEIASENDGDEKYVSFSAADGVPEEIVTAVTGKQIRVVSLGFSCGDGDQGSEEGTVEFHDSDDVNLSGTMNFATNGGMAESLKGGLFQTGVGKALEVTATGLICNGHITYIEV